ncbi:NAD(P)/FAD-dependent oxidoreductase [Tepidibacter hydrothermalis]|uniref:FAD-dependent oxidoreductase n=1 Tax=Tepidibacter hydrothermalis TaxID=3036126 RepID=A0ABY8EFI8_9FIRM|nr:FAD-dependent oxidoreductase [Tepidibacter hydrothermalis]WFD10615.1 FAD-dependent oxidoreductase [Tepidibacter hydrothermalis]
MHIVIIGNSAAGLSALEAFRKYDKKSSVTLISKEGGIAYSRVLLPYYLRGKIDHDTFFIRDEEFYKKMNVNYIESCVVDIDEDSKVVKLDDDKSVSYDKLLITTGSSAVKPPIPGLDNEGVYNMWTLDDAHKIEPLFKEGKKVLVLGSGFVSLQAAWAALYKGLDVKIIELAPRIMPRVLDEKGSSILHNRIIELGADLRVNTLTEKIEKKEDGTFVVHTKGEDPFEVDLIIVGTGVRPNTQFLKGTSIEVDRGILVDETMKTNIEGIYAAGDVAQGLTTFGEKHVIHALWPTAVEMGKIAGANMAGKELEYQGSLNMNVTEMFKITVASMGRFNDGEGDKVWVYEDEKTGGYMKVIYENDLVVGATVVGSSDMVPFLGKLRPIIRKKIKAECSPDKLASYLQIKAAKATAKIEL